MTTINWRSIVIAIIFIEVVMLLVLTYMIDRNITAMERSLDRIELEMDKTDKSLDELEQLYERGIGND